jgi:GH24 family phage-related lysozyme (muramidase)
MQTRIFVVVWLCLFVALFPKTPLILEHKIINAVEFAFPFIIELEGKRNKAYKDARGFWTTGVGHLIKHDEVHLIATTLTDEQVEELFKSDLKGCEDAVLSSVRVPLTVNQKSALYSLCFNIGIDSFKASSVVRSLNQGRYKEAANHFMDWVTPSVLVPRRHKEKTLFLQDI